MKHPRCITICGPPTYYSHICLITYDFAAGHPGRYTVYKIPSSPSRPTKTIGLELPLRDAKKIAKNSFKDILLIDAIYDTRKIEN